VVPPVRTVRPTKFIPARRTVTREREFSALLPQLPAPAADELIEEEPINIDGDQPLGKVFISLRNIDLWIFGNMQTSDARQNWLESRLNLKLEEIQREHSCTAEQLAKLRLAGKGDIKHFFEHVEINRRQFETVRRDEDKAIDHLIRLTPLEEEFEKGPFGEGSFFSKIRATMITDASERK
jgi:hypothetical protein